MSTPKEKAVKSQTLANKKRRIHKIMLSGSNNEKVALSAAALAEQFQPQLEKLLESIVQNYKDSLNTGSIVDNISQTNQLSVKKEKIAKLSKSCTFKCADIIFGINETMRQIQRQQLAMVLLDRSLAVNLTGVLFKLCAANRVACFQIDLSIVRRLFKISSASVMSFRKCVLQEKSIFHPVYRLLLSTLDAKAQNEAHNNKEIEPPKVDDDDTLKQKTQLDSVSDGQHNSITMKYASKSDDSYQRVMHYRLNRYWPTYPSVSEMISQTGFISLSCDEKSSYFPEYKEAIGDDSPTRLEVILQEEQSKEELNQSAHRLTEKLFELDNEQKNLFIAPKLVKCQLPAQDSKNVKKQNKKNKTQ